MKRFLPLVLLSLLLLGCKKEGTKEPDKEENFKLTGLYVPAASASLDGVVMLTKNDKITDQTKITNFLARNGNNLTRYFDFAGSTGSVNLALNYIDFKTENNATLGWEINSKDVSKNAIISKQSNNELLITNAKADTAVYGNQPFVSQITVDVQKYPVRSSYFLSSPTIYSVVETYRFPIEVINGQPHIPLITSYLNQPSKGISFSSNAMNIINPTLQSSLGANDTVVIQTKHLRMIKPL